MYDFTYVENVAHAHICAERALASGDKDAERASGQVNWPNEQELCFSTVLDIATRPSIVIWVLDVRYFLSTKTNLHMFKPLYSA